MPAHRRADVVLGTAWIVCLCLAGPVLAQDGIPRAAKEATSMEAYVTQIRALVSDTVSGLGSEDPESQRAAREKLIAETAIAAGVAASPEYLAEYAAVVGTNINALLKHPDVRVRLNVGIVVARVAERANNTALADAAIALLNDSSDVVALWGAKSARFVLPTLLSTDAKKAKALAIAVVQAAKRHPIAPAAQDGYDALSLGQKASGADLAALAPELISLFEWRVSQYITGLPEEPESENSVVLFLTVTAWSNLTPQQRLQSMQALTNLLSLSAQQSAAREPKERESVINVLQRAARGISVVRELRGDVELQAVAKPLFAIMNSAPAEQIMSNASGLFTAVKARPAFKDLKEAPTIQPPAASEAQPATEPNLVKNDK